MYQHQHIVRSAGGSHEGNSLKSDMTCGEKNRCMLASMLYLRIAARPLTKEGRWRSARHGESHPRTVRNAGDMQVRIHTSTRVEDIRSHMAVVQLRKCKGAAVAAGCETSRTGRRRMKVEIRRAENGDVRASRSR